MQSYWTIPREESEYVTGLAVTKGLKNDGTDDKIHVLTMNPMCVSTMTPISKQVDQILLSNFINLNKIYQPRFNIASDNSRNLWIHEESVSTFNYYTVKNLTEILQQIIRSY